eukprot:8938453-Pyramimonas_sp.AAC.1
MGRFLQPSAGGRSLTAALLFAAGPTWYASVAPIVRRSKEIWACMVGAYQFGLNLAELRGAWA